MCDTVLIYAPDIWSQIFTDTRVARRRLGTGRITRSKKYHRRDFWYMLCLIYIKQISEVYHVYIRYRVVYHALSAVIPCERGAYHEISMRISAFSAPRYAASTCRSIWYVWYCTDIIVILRASYHVNANCATSSSVSRELRLLWTHTRRQWVLLTNMQPLLHRTGPQLGSWTLRRLQASRCINGVSSDYVRIGYISRDAILYGRSFPEMTPIP